MAKPTYEELWNRAKKLKKENQRLSREVEPYEYDLITKDGRKLNVIITTKLIQYEGERAILGIVTNITQRKK